MLQTRTVEPRTLALLKELMQNDLLNEFYLVGGTALALQIGHRKSIDLDFFTVSEFIPDSLIENLGKQYSIEIMEQTNSMLITTINDIKVDFVKMSYPILFPSLNIENVRMLSMKDIAPMKLKAVVQRGSKKDFYDIYFLLQFMNLDEIINLFKQKFQQYETFQVIKSLTYFEDAEGYANPILFDKSTSWETIKNSLKTTVFNYLN